MFHVKYLFYFILLHLVIAIPQLNLYYTDWVSESNNALQHDCFRIAGNVKYPNASRKIMSYCMSELSSTFHIETNDEFPKFTFTELSKRNINSQQLYLWSAPIDLIERYQFYLETANDSVLAIEVFYNCTWPRFGPMCQYELYYYYPNHLPLHKFIDYFYSTYTYDPTNLTCYTHLKCNRGPSPICLDWSEICDGGIDCIDSGIDEEYCWQLEINECKDDEYRCTNGQCIPKSFYFDDYYVPDCLDGSDEGVRRIDNADWSGLHEPSFGREDMTCARTYLTSSCVAKRKTLLLEIMFSIKDSSASENCSAAFECILDVPHSEQLSCNELCVNNACFEIIENTCPDMIYISNTPFMFGHIYLAYKKSEISKLVLPSPHLPYFCFNNHRYDNYFVEISKIYSFNNRTCYLVHPMVLPYIVSKSWQHKYHTVLNHIYASLTRYNPIINYRTTICNKSNMYQCANSSKCISIHRLMDRINDCLYRDDENINITEQLKKTYFKCETSNTYISPISIKDGHCDCGYIIDDWCDDEQVGSFNFRKYVSFQTICDGFTELLPIIINEQNQTDETECEQWECNNIYTHCNGIWNCLNGADEINCPLSVSFNCSANHHLCVSPDANQFMCLPIEQANDGKVDCLGGIDEPKLCQLNEAHLQYEYKFHCISHNYDKCIHYLELCNNYSVCDNGDDEQFCEKNRRVIGHLTVCSSYFSQNRSDVEKFLCTQIENKKKQPVIFFSLGTSNSIEDLKTNIENTLVSDSSSIKIFDPHKPRCHRGLDLLVWLNNKNNLTANTCLCPPSFYGDQCQFQNQRISLTIKFRTLSDSWGTLFAIVILLIDDSKQRIIHSYEQFTYLSVRDCQIKFHIYLLYFTRPKNLTKNYSIHIDMYEKISFKYRGSVLLPVHFPFLPVHRLAFIVDIPRSDDRIQDCSHEECIHGKCIRYSNNPQTSSFCQCDKGWSGQYCTIQHTCTCASNSLCIGIAANNRSICVCPLNRFGPRCLLNNTICQNNDNSTCQNSGQCISNDDYMTLDQKFTCICQKGFSGDRCEIADNKLILSFDKDIILTQQLFVHFIEVINNDQLVRTTTFQTLPYGQDSVMIYWSRLFHLVFIELINKNYYLATVRIIYNRSATIEKMIILSDRCPNISEIFNETFLQWDLLRRIKYYHLPCQNQSLNLSCFHDNVHLCLCQDLSGNHVANCFNFDHNMTFDCLGQSECENGAQCFQDSPTCPRRSICICPACYYGRRCQFSTNGFGLSLDAILGYHILPHLSFNQQPFITKMSLALTIMFMITGFINSVLCLITFKNKIIREVGCGLYLLGSSITTLLTMTMFGLKFLILILAQMTIISNRTFLEVQCHSFDFILRVCLCMDQWLNACVATERAVTIIKATRFDKKQSKRVAKYVIVIVLLIIIGTSIHDPIYRHLIDEENDDEVQRTWCIVRYSSSLQTYNSIMHIFHFFGPFILNFVSAIILITKKSRQQSSIHSRRSYNEILREQFLQHKHLLTAPVILVILAVPRLIITFISKCMKSTDDSWLFLIGYFISFIPPMVTFLVFIVPSKFYKKQFRKSVDHYRTILQRQLHLTS